MMLRRAAGPAGQGLPGVESLAKMIQQWERGDHVPGPIYRPLYARLTDKPETELFKEAMLVPNQAREDESAPPAGTVVQSPASSQEDDVRRRAALQAITALGAGVAIPPGILETALSGIEDALGNPLDVAEWERLVADYDHRLNTAAAGTLVGDLTADIVALGELSKRRLPPLQQAGLLRIGAALSGLLAIEFEDAADERAARTAWGTARRAADASGDRTMRVWARGYAARVAFWTGRAPAVVAGLANEAERIADGKPSAGLAGAYAARTWLAVQEGDTEKVHALLAESNRLCAKLADSDVAHSKFAYRETQRLWSEAYAYVHIGDKRAEASLSQARALYPANALAPRVNLTLMESVSLIKAKDVEGGLQSALNAIEGQTRTSAGGRLLAGSLVAHLPEKARTLPEAHEIRTLTKSV